MKAEKLVEYISSLSDFQILTPGYPYGHMGATITDAVLQAGLNWETVVKPRLEKVRSYKGASTTSGFLNLLEKLGAKEILDWLDDEKPNRVLGLARFFKEKGLESEDNLASWLNNEENQVKLKQQRGIGNKTLDYLKMLSGVPSVAVDRHLYRFLDKAEASCIDYSEAHAVISEAAKIMGIDSRALDHSIWKYMSTKY